MKETFKDDALRIYFFDKNKVEIENVNQTTVEKLVPDIDRNIKSAFVSSANSLGFMDGGSDLGYMNAISGIQTLVQKGFKEMGLKSTLGRYWMPIGGSMGFKLESNVYFISSPTMNMPQNVSGTHNQYYALKSALYLCYKLGIKNVYCPMMCTNWGGYSYLDSYNIMIQACNDYKNTTEWNCFMKDVYNYILPSIDVLCNISFMQPKEYANIEFYISTIYDRSSIIKFKKALEKLNISDICKLSKTDRNNIKIFKCNSCNYIGLNKSEHKLLRLTPNAYLPWESAETICLSRDFTDEMVAEFDEETRKITKTR